MEHRSEVMRAVGSSEDETIERGQIEYDEEIGQHVCTVHGPVHPDPLGWNDNLGSALYVCESCHANRRSGL